MMIGFQITSGNTDFLDRLSKLKEIIFQGIYSNIPKELFKENEENK